MKWIPQEERLPTGVDADADGYVFIRYPPRKEPIDTHQWIGQRIKWYLVMPNDCEWLEGAFNYGTVDTESTGQKGEQ